MNTEELQKKLKAYKHCDKADYYMQCLSHMNLFYYCQEYGVNDIDKYLISDWKRGMDDLYEDYAGFERRRRFQHQLAIAGKYNKENLPPAILTAVLDGDDGWHDE